MTAIYYSPTELFRGRDKLQAFTAIGIVDAGEPYQFDMGNGFCPFRRNVAWFDAREAPIAPLLGTLEFASGRGWGVRLRFGLLTVSDHDFEAISVAMSVAATATASCDRR